MIKYDSAFLAPPNDDQFGATCFEGVLDGCKVASQTGETFTCRRYWRVLFDFSVDVQMYSTCNNNTRFDSGLSLWRLESSSQEYSLIDANDDRCGLQSRLHVDVHEVRNEWDTDDNSFYILLGMMRSSFLTLCLFDIGVYFVCV